MASSQPDNAHGIGVTEWCGIRVDHAQQSATRNGLALALTAAELRLLVYFLRAPGETFTREQLLKAITEGKAVISKRAVDVHVCMLRRKLGPPVVIKTIRLVGYCLESNEKIAE
jgi:two-component system, OmpR family, response regulator